MLHIIQVIFEREDYTGPKKYPIRSRKPKDTPVTIDVDSSLQRPPLRSVHSSGKHKGQLNFDELMVRALQNTESSGNTKSSVNTKSSLSLSLPKNRDPFAEKSNSKVGPRAAVRGRTYFSQVLSNCGVTAPAMKDKVIAHVTVCLCMCGHASCDCVYVYVWTCIV